MRRTVASVLAVGAIVATTTITACQKGPARLSTASPGMSGHESPGTGGNSADRTGYPRRITQGTYDGPLYGSSADPGAVARGEAAAAQEDAKGKFRGWVGPFYVWPDSRDRLENESLPTGARSNYCLHSSGTHTVTAEEVASSGYAIETPSYLPPGTFEEIAPSGGACDGAVVMTTRQFFLDPPSYIRIGIIRFVGSNVAEFSASAERVKRGGVNGKDAVFIDPITPEGFGGSAVFIKESWGWTKVGADNLPFSELLKVAEAMKP